MKAKTKRTIGWTLLASLILAIFFYIPYLFYPGSSMEELGQPWYHASFVILGGMLALATFIGIMWLLVYLIGAED